MRRSFANSAFASIAATLLLASLPYDGDARSAERGHRHIPSWYFSLGGSVNFVDNTALTEQGGPTPGSGNMEFDEGYGLNASVGYRPRYTNTIWDNLRMEFEFGVLDNDVDQIALSGNGVVVPTGDVQVMRGMANLFVDFDLSKQVRPYIGGGLGLARVELENEEDTAFAYQGMLGISYIPESFPISEFYTGYRYFSITDTQFTTPGSGSQVEFGYDSHVLDAGVRFYF